MKCGQPANYSQRTFESEERVAVGASDKYEARCRMCFVPHADAPTVHELTDLSAVAPGQSRDEVVQVCDRGLPRSIQFFIDNKMERLVSIRSLQFNVPYRKVSLHNGFVSRKSPTRGLPVVIQPSSQEYDNEAKAPNPNCGFLSANRSPCRTLHNARPD